MIKKAKIFELSPDQIERLAENLPMKNKIRLAHKLEKDTSKAKMDSAVRNMRRAIKEALITSEEIDHICESVKREYDEKHHRSRS